MTSAVHGMPLTRQTLVFQKQIIWINLFFLSIIPINGDAVSFFISFVFLLLSLAKKSIEVVKHGNKKPKIITET